MARQPKNALDEAVKAAVRAALDEHLPTLLSEHLPSPTQTRDKPSADDSTFPGERFISMAEMCKRLGLNRTTILRRERAQQIPKRQTFPDGRTGWSSAQLDDWFASAKPSIPDLEKNLALAARLGNVEAPHDGMR